MILDMSDALEGFLQTVTRKTVATASVDFVKTQTVTGKVVLAVVQPARRTDINKDVMDYSLRYIQVHSKEVMQVGQFIQYQGEDWEIIQPGAYGDYGYYEVFAQQCKSVMEVDVWI